MGKYADMEIEAQMNGYDSFNEYAESELIPNQEEHEHIINCVQEVANIITTYTEKHQIAQADAFYCSVLMRLLIKENIMSLQISNEITFLAALAHAIRTEDLKEIEKITQIVTDWMAMQDERKARSEFMAALECLMHNYLNIKDELDDLYNEMNNV